MAEENYNGAFFYGLWVIAVTAWTEIVCWLQQMNSYDAEQFCQTFTPGFPMKLVGFETIPEWTDVTNFQDSVGNLEFKVSMILPECVEI
ncbi:hypothetical protein B566_EDAN013477 [Ephemera danica]|nr:hypothetical protein B566_EDAN013477 [Ephemera danica]